MDRQDADVVARVQAAIEDGTAWRSEEFGKRALSLVREQKCELPPGVVTMWLRDDGTYEPIYTAEELNQRVAGLLKVLPQELRDVQQSQARLGFLRAHHDELVRLRTEEILGEPFDPVLAAIGAAVALFLASVWFVGREVAAVVALLAAALCYGRQLHRRRQLHRLRAQAKVAALLG